MGADGVVAWAVLTAGLGDLGDLDFLDLDIDGLSL